MAVQLKQIKYEAILEALAGETECGDQYLVKELPDSTLIAVVDGLGHGVNAALAAKKAIQVLDDYATESVEKLFKLCNEALKETRGAAMTIAKLSLQYKLTYMGVGNVTGIYWKFNQFNQLKQTLFSLENGIVGTQLPPMQAEEITMSPGDIFILATDGINIQFAHEPPKLSSPDKIAENIFQIYRNKKDDGLIMVVQLL
jgi:negative regulator of sigma-B (phosphoserine phosphatase)